MVILKLKNTIIRKGYTMYDSNYITSLKKQNYEHNRGWGEGQR